MRNFINLIENQLSPTLEKNITAIIVQAIRGSNGLQSQLADDYGYDNQIDDPDYQSLTSKRNFKSWLKNWINGQIMSSYDRIRNLTKGDTIRAWRMIAAPPDWKPDNQHVGIYWSYEKDAADLYWGMPKDDDVSWLIEADLYTNTIDWVPTIAQNAIPDYEYEKEIRIIDNSPVKIINYGIVNN